MKNKGIGLDVKQPAEKCSDHNCPFHGTTGARGRILTGVVTSDKMSKTVTVSWERRVYVPKYERYEKRKSKVNAHNPDCIDAKKGDVVRISETRPLSKTKHFAVIEIMGKESKRDLLKQEAIINSESPGAKSSPASAKENEEKESRKKN